MENRNLEVAVVGMGNVGWEVAKFIAMMNPVPEAKHSIGKLLIFSRNRENAKISGQALQGLRSGYMKGLDIRSCHTDTLSDFMPHIVINCASKPEARQYKDRREMGKANLELNREISSQIPDDALEIIVTNHILTLSQDAVNWCGRNPELTIGCAHVDSIRAGIAVEEYLTDSLTGKIDKDNIFVIGSHDDNEMVLAYNNATVNNIRLRELKSLAGQFLNVQEFASLFAHMQVMARNTTSELTAKAVIDTLRAVMTEKDYVSAGVLCDFNSKFFRADPDFFRFEKPDKPVYMAMRTGFNDLKAGFIAGGDANPGVRWFAEQAEETKRDFYRIAMRQYEYLKSNSVI